MNDITPEIARSIKLARLKAGLSQEKLALAIGISKRTLIKYESGESEISANDLFKISQFCHVDLSSVLYSSETPQTDTPVSETEVIKTPYFYEYRIEASIPAGIADIQERTSWYESDILDYDPRSHFFLQIDEEYGYSMMPFIEPGDLVLISLTAKIKNGNIVAAKWDETKGAIKIFNESPDRKNIALLSYNPSVSPVFLERNRAQVFKVVLIKKMN